MCAKERYRAKEEIDRKIRKSIEDVCPAFHYHPDEGAAEWHKCKCDVYDHGSCVCVWHDKSECKAGIWPQLEWLEEKQEKDEAHRQQMLKEARRANKAEKEADHDS